MKKKLKEIIIVSTIYLLLTLILTYPLITHFNTHQAGDAVDGWVFSWNMWWMKKAIVELRQNPYFTDYVYYPSGITLIFHVLSPFNSIVSIPLQFFLNIETAYNSLVILSFVLSGLGMYLLAFYLTKNRFASIMAGFLFTFCPHRMGHALGHLHMMSTEFIPFYVLYLLKAFNEKSKKNIILASIFLVLTASCSWYFLLACLILTVCYVIYIWCRKEISFRIMIMKTASIFVISFLALSPLFISMVWQSLNIKFIGEHNPEIWSADLLSFFIPSNIQVLSRIFPHFKSIFSSFTGNTAESSNYIGFMVLLLSIYGIIKCKKNICIYFLCLSGIVFLNISLGPYLHIKGQIYYSIPLLYKFLHNTLFFFKFSGVPERFFIMVMFSFSLLAAFGLKSLLGINHSLTKHLVVVIVVLIILVEYICVPFMVTSFEVSPFIENMARDKKDYAIIHVPYYSIKGLYYQTIHNKKIVGGFLSRVPEVAYNYLLKTPIITNILHGIYPVKVNYKETYSSPPHNFERINSRLLSYEETRAWTQELLKKLNIRYVIFEQGQDDKFLRSCDFPVIYEDKLIKVYEPL